MKVKLSNRILFLFVLSLVSISGAQRSSQILLKENQSAFKLAIRLERLEQYKEAEELYLEILKENPKDSRVYFQLKSIYQRLEKFNDLETLIRNRLILLPNDLQSHVELGEVFLLQDEMEKALVHWDNLVYQYSHSKTIYLILMQMYMKHQFEERLNDLVAQGRHTFNDPSLFSLELGNTYFRTHNYKKATDEFITFAIYHPKQISTASTFIMRMSDQTENQQIIEARLKARLLEKGDVIRLLYSDFLFTIGRYDDAFDQHLESGISKKEDLERWLQLANGLRKENQLPLALDAYSVILDAIPKLPDNRQSSHYRRVTGEALYGLALTYERQIVPTIQFQSLAGFFPNNVFFEDHLYRIEAIEVLPLEETFALYDSILTTLPTSSFSPQAHYRLGEIKYRVTRNLDAALNSFQAVVDLSKDRKLTRDATVRIVDVLMTKGDFQGALDFINQKIMLARSGDEKESYLIKRCHILFLSENVDSTLFHLNELINLMKTTNLYFNDVFELKGFLDENYIRASAEEKKAFIVYMSGERLMKQSKLSEAQSFFADVFRKYPDAPIADEAAFRKASIHLLLNDNNAAISDLIAIQDSPLGDLATIMIGEIYDRYVNNPKEAIQWYLNVLDTYPGSVLAEPVRYRIREINKAM